jgi:hypothetical protein
VIGVTGFGFGRRSRGDAGDVAFRLLDRDVGAELLSAQHAEQLGEEMRTHDENELSFGDCAKDLGRRAERRDERGDEDAGVDDDSTQLRGWRVALGAEGVELGVGKRQRFVRNERVLFVPRPDLLDLEAEVPTERILDDLGRVTPRTGSSS